ncbi:MAG: hypothetical protein WA755_00375 [Candidatus Acidiferrales bacterium]
MLPTLIDKLFVVVTCLAVFGGITTGLPVDAGHEFLRSRDAYNGPGVVLDAGQPAQGAPYELGHLIRPGVSVGNVRLGSTRDEILQVLTSKPAQEEVLLCGRIDWINWLDVENGHRSVFIYIKDDRAFQIASWTPRFKTAEGITYDSDPSAVRTHYPNMTAYVLRGSGNDAVGGKDLIYWVDSDRGIAFELYYNHRLRARRVGNVFVFKPGVTFLPGGCLDWPQEWAELPPYSLKSESTSH